MTSDSDDRRKESISYLNRRQDQVDSSQLQRDRTEAVYRGLRERDDWKVRSALGLSPADASAAAAPPRKPTASEKFRQHSTALLFHLEWNEVFPASLLKQWHDHVGALDIERPRASLRLLAALSESYDDACRRFKPPNIELSRSMQFDEQVPRIGREIDWLIRVLEHVLAYEAQRRPQDPMTITRRFTTRR
jgi:hypothetical protein